MLAVGGSLKISRPLFHGRAISCFAMEHLFICPYCGEEISMILDLSVRRQSYVEDCEVCCNPIQITYSVEDDSVDTFEAKTLE